MAAPILAAYRHRYAEVADFAYVYVEEAHASDEWPLGDVESFAQPRTMDERLALARRFAEEYAAPAGALFGDAPIPVYVDTMANELERRYAVWPERLFVLEDGQVAYVSQPCNEYGFDRREIDTFLSRRAGHAERRRERLAEAAMRTEAEGADGAKKQALPAGEETGLEPAVAAAAAAWHEPENA